MKTSSSLEMEKNNFLTQAQFKPKLFYPKKCVNCEKNKFTKTKKQRKMYLKTTINKIRLPHIYRGKEICKDIEKNRLLN